MQLPFLVLFHYLFVILFCYYQKMYLSILSFFKRFFVYFEGEGKGREKRGRASSICGCLSCVPPLGTLPIAQTCVPTENQTSNPLLPSLVLNPLSHTSQGNSLLFWLYFLFHLIWVFKFVNHVFQFQKLFFLLQLYFI